MAKKELETLPGYSRGVRQNSAVRTIVLARPICPFSKIEMVRDSNGNYRPKDRGPDEANCQLAGGEWWKMCEEKGHDPYFTTRTWTVPEDIIEEDAQGRVIKTGEQLIRHEERYPNTAQVPVTIRHNQGRLAILKIEKHGFKRLEDIGYYEVCEFRNCQRPVNVKFKSQKYGAFCSKEHLQLVIADAESEMLHYPNSMLNGVNAQKIQRMREQQLQQLSVGVID